MTIFTVVRFLLPAAIPASLTFSPATIRSDFQKASPPDNRARRPVSTVFGATSGFEVVTMFQPARPSLR